MKMLHLVFEVDRRIEVGNLRIDRFTDHFTFTGMNERPHLCLKEHQVGLFASRQCHLPSTAAGGPYDC